MSTKNYPSQILFSSLLIALALNLTACSSNPSPWTESVSESVAEPVAAEPIVEAVSEPLPVVEPAAPAVELPQATHDVRIKSDYPREYVVKKGDTLWGIASQFLEDPWYWPEIWYRNPQLDNPHLIFPGDMLSLTYINGKPTLEVKREVVVEQIPGASSDEKVVRTDTGKATNDGRKVVRLSPVIHRSDREISIPSIPSDAIKQFLNNPRVITKNELDDSPYIVASDDARLILASEDRIYVRDIHSKLDRDKVRYSVYRRGDEFRDPETEDVLGFEIIYVGEARIDLYGDPASATLTNTRREVLIGDFLLNSDKSEFNHFYYPKVPKHAVDARIISLFDALSASAKYQIVVINKGEEAGIEVGHVLATYFRGGEARDKYMARKTFERGQEDKIKVILPDERSGLMMIFKVFDKVSYGLILESRRIIRLNDAARTPQ